jgi:hypothetical protein
MDQTPEADLLKSAIAGNTRKVHKLLHLYCNHHSSNSTASSKSIELSPREVGRVLLCLCKARINGTTTNITLLSPKIDVVLALCRHHPSVLPCAVTKRGTTALMGAALRGYATVCQALLEEGADIDAVNDQNQTALSFALR